MTDPRDMSPRTSRLVASHAALAGLCPLLPVPFLDALLIRRIARRMHRALFEAHGLTLTPAVAKLLTAQPRWFRGAASSVALLPLKRVIRKVALVLSLKDCADVATVVFHDGWLIGRVLADSHELFPGRSPTDPRALRHLRKAMLRTYRDVDPAPLRRALVGAFLGAKVGAGHAVQAVRRLLGAKRQPLDQATADEVEDLSSRMRTAAMEQWQYLDHLERRFRHHLGLPEQRAGDSLPGA
jgi:uncharacterized protein (DUF697 family)